MKKRNTSNFDSPDRLNLLVEGTRVKGDLVTESSIRIDGELVGNLASSAKVVLGKNGVLRGDLISQEADIEGTVEGTLKVEGLLVLRAAANIKGDIKCLKIQIEEGAQFSGKCVMGNSVDKPKVAAVSEADLVY